MIAADEFGGSGSMVISFHEEGVGELEIIDSIPEPSNGGLAEGDGRVVQHRTDRVQMFFEIHEEHLARGQPEALAYVLEVGEHVGGKLRIFRSL